MSLVVAVWSTPERQGEAGKPLAGQSRSSAVCYSDNPCIETEAVYLGVLKTFADLVLRGEAPDETLMQMKQKPGNSLSDTGA